MLIVSIIYAVVGLFLIIWPDQARLVICYVLGAAAVLYGAFRIIWYFAHKDVSTGIRFGVALGIASFVLGLFLLFKANAVVAVLAAIIGVAVIIESVMRLQIALDIRRVGGQYWLPVCLSAIAMLAFGVLLLFNPFTAVDIATVIAGVALILDAAFTIWSLYQSKKWMNKRTVIVH